MSPSRERATSRPSRRKERTYKSDDYEYEVELRYDRIRL